MDASSPKLRLHEQTRRRLIQTIESRIGRPIQPRSSKPIDPRLSDYTAPNCYEWKFTPSYQGFPEAGISRWSAEQHRLCNEALDMGHLTVSIARTITSGAQSQGNNTSRGNMAHNTTTESPRSDAVPAANTVLPKDPSVENQNSTTSRNVVSDVFAEMQSRIAMSLKHEEDLRKRAEAQSVAASLELAELQKKADAQSAASSFELTVLQEKLEAQTAAASSELAELRLQLAELKNQAGDARREGEIAGREQAIDSMDGERRALTRHHIEEIKTARDEAFSEGFKAGRQKSFSTSSRNQTSTPAEAQDGDGDAATELEQLKHTRAELKLAREQGKREGRELAFKELALGGKESMIELVGNNSELHTNRKIRELRTIYQNWHDTPQSALPAYMLPPEHVPGDKTLYLLAKLSKEVSAQEAGQLLREEIDRRQEHLVDSVRSLIVTNADIKKVLNRICPPSRSRQDDQFNPPRLEDSPTIVTENIHNATEPSQPTTQNTRPAVNSEAYSGTGNNVRDLPTTESDTGKSSGSQLPYNTSSKSSSSVSQLHRIFEALEQPMGSDIPSHIETFPPSFLRESVGGNEYTFAKVGPSMLDKQVVSWPEVIRINPEHHELAPCLGSHGALTFVNGKQNCGTIGSQYPAILRQSKDAFEYIGHYKIVDRALIPVEEWKSWREGRRHAIAKEIAESAWGDALLMEHSLHTEGMMQDERIKEILAFFEKATEPNLRMSWTIIQFVTFVKSDYEALISAFKAFQERGPVPSSGVSYSQQGKNAKDSTTKRKHSIGHPTTGAPKRAKKDSSEDEKLSPFVSDDDDIYNASPRPERFRRSINVQDADLPRLSSSSDPAPPGKKLLASVSRGNEILRTAMKKCYQATVSDDVESI